MTYIVWCSNGSIAAANGIVSPGRGSVAIGRGIRSRNPVASFHSCPCGERLAEEACAGNPPAGFCEGETDNRAGSNHVTLLAPKGGSNREYKADLHSGAVLPTRRATLSVAAQASSRHRECG